MSFFAGSISRTSLAQDTVNEIYGAFFGSHKPARVIVPTKALHNGALIEIEAVAELPTK